MKHVRNGYRRNILIGLTSALRKPTRYLHKWCEVDYYDSGYGLTVNFSELSDEPTGFMQAEISR
jgi:hypothetical protein